LRWELAVSQLVEDGVVGFWALLVPENGGYMFTSILERSL
jgi:hypothetical protein